MATHLKLLEPVEANLYSNMVLVVAAELVSPTGRLPVVAVPKKILLPVNAIGYATLPSVVVVG